MVQHTKGSGTHVPGLSESVGRGPPLLFRQEENLFRQPLNRHLKWGRLPARDPSRPFLSDGLPPYDRQRQQKKKFQHILYIRAHRDWPLRPKIENRDSHTWIFIGNWILMWVCFLHFFDLSTSSAAKMRFYFLPFLQGKRAQNRPENPQNWNLAKIGLKSDNFTK